MRARDRHLRGGGAGRPRGRGDEGGLAAAAGSGVSEVISARTSAVRGARSAVAGWVSRFAERRVSGSEASAFFGSARRRRRASPRGARATPRLRAPPPPPRAPPPPPSRTGSRNPTRATRGPVETRGKRVSYAANRSRSRRGTERFGSHSRSFRRDARFFPSRPPRPPRARRTEGASRSPSSRGRTRGNPPAAIPGSPPAAPRDRARTRGVSSPRAFATTRLSPCAPRFSVSAQNSPRRARTSSGARRRRG